MKIQALTVGMVQTNCYIAYDEESREAFVVDPGAEPDRILGFIRENALRVTDILLTHSHFDHVMALSDLYRATGAAVCVHTLEKENIEKALHPELHAMRLPDPGIAPVPVSHALEDGDRLTLLGRTFTVLHTPGHTPGSVCYDDGENLFSGDTLFALSCGRIDLPGGNAADMRASLKRLGEIPENRMVYPGHESRATLAYIAYCNPYFREQQEDE